jgi:hypothetical protein
MLRRIVELAVVGLGLIGFMAVAGEKAGDPVKIHEIRFEPAKTEKGEMIKVSTRALTFFAPSILIQEPDKTFREIKAKNGFMTGAEPDSLGNLQTWRSSRLSVYLGEHRQVPAAPANTHKNSK